MRHFAHIVPGVAAEQKEVPVRHVFAVTFRPVHSQPCGEPVCILARQCENYAVLCGHHRRHQDRRLLQSQWRCLLLGTRQSCRGLSRLRGLSSWSVSRQPVPHDCGGFVESASGKPSRCRRRRLILGSSGLPRRRQRLALMSRWRVRLFWWVALCSTWQGTPPTWTPWLDLNAGNPRFAEHPLQWANEINQSLDSPEHRQTHASAFHGHAGVPR